MRRKSLKLRRKILIALVLLVIMGVASAVEPQVLLGMLKLFSSPKRVAGIFADVQSGGTPALKRAVSKMGEEIEMFLDAYPKPEREWIRMYVEVLVLYKESFQARLNGENKFAITCLDKADLKLEKLGKLMQKYRKELE